MQGGNLGELSSAQPSWAQIFREASREVLGAHAGQVRWPEGEQTFAEVLRLLDRLAADLGARSGEGAVYRLGRASAAVLLGRQPATSPLRGREYRTGRPRRRILHTLQILIARLGELVQGSLTLAASEGGWQVTLPRGAGHRLEGALYRGMLAECAAWADGGKSYPVQVVEGETLRYFISGNPQQ